MHTWYHVLAVDVHLHVPGSPQGYVEYGSVLGHVYVLAGEHRFGTLPEPRSFRQGDEQPHGLGSEPVLGVVKHEVRRLDDHRGSPVGLIGEQSTQVHVAQGGEMVSQSLPFGRGADLS